MSADLPGVVSDDFSGPDNGVSDATYEALALRISHDMQDSLPGTQLEGSSRHELVFIDTATPSYRELLDDILANGQTDREVEVVTLDSAADGLKQISIILGERHDIDAVHIVSHGGDGTIQLGSRSLSVDMLDDSIRDISSWGNALSQDADLLLYGCNLAAGEDGQVLLSKLASLTGADVAASDDLTGNSNLGGDWTLEYHGGQIDTGIVFSTSLQQTWTGTLAVTWLDATTGTPISGPTNNDDIFIGDDTSNTGPVDGSNGNDVIYGGGGDDYLEGGNGDDVIYGGVGDDTITVKNGVNVLSGGAGNDSLTGGNRSDVLLGGEGDDTLTVTNNVGNVLNGGPGNDILNGGRGKDTLIGGGGHDTMNGGTNNDRYFFTGAQDGDVYTVSDSGGVNDVIDLSDYGFAAVDDTATPGVITVNLGGGKSFTINHAGIETVLKSGAGANHPPEANAGNDQFVTTNAVVTLDASATTDADLDALSYRWVQLAGPWVGVHGSTDQTPNFTAPGTASHLLFAVIVNDGTTQDTDIVHITVGSDTGAPTVVNNTGIVVSEGSASTITGTELRYDDQQPASSIAFTVTTGPAHGRLAFVDTPSAPITEFTQYDIDAGRVVYTHDGGETSADDFVFDVSDAQGNALRGQTFSLSIAPVNDAPITANVSVVGDEDTSAIAISLTGNDVDGTVETFRLSELPTRGELYTDANLTVAASVGTEYAAAGETVNFYFVPAPNWNGTTEFGYVAMDDGGLLDPTPATATLIVNAVNDPPVAKTVRITIVEDSAYSFHASDFSFSDVEGDPMVSVTINNISLAGGILMHGGGTIVRNGDTLDMDQITTLLFRPTTDANGPALARFDFTVNDSEPGVSGAQATIDVTPLNDRPSIQGPQSQSTVIESPLTFSTLGGNALRIIDPDSGVERIQVSLQVSNGTLTLPNTTNLVFTVGTGINESTMVFTGPLADVNSSLDGLVFRPDEAYQGFANLQIVVDDLGNGGSGAAMNTVETVSIEVTDSHTVSELRETPPPLDAFVDGGIELPDTSLNPLDIPPEGAPMSAGDQALSEAAQAPIAFVPPDTNPMTALTDDLVVDSSREQVGVPLPFDGFSESGNDDSYEHNHHTAWQAARIPFHNPMPPERGLDTVATDSPLWSVLEQMLEQMDSDDSKRVGDREITIETAAGLTLTLTAGYVSWMLRAGYLSASLLSITPFWRYLDPLPVLSRPPTRKSGKVAGADDPSHSSEELIEKLFDQKAPLELWEPAKQ
jgi:Ca2+-binding RTX toxin-like protein